MPGFEIFGEEERREVRDVLETGVLMRYGFDGARGGHWKARTLETELARRLGAGYCHVCASGTAALGIALAACGVGAGDEVIVPPFTFVATIEALLTAGAVPVFADIDDTLCLDPQAVEAAVTQRTRAVIVVHMCGAMARIADIKALCDRKNLVLIEDACQSVGATMGGKALGTFGHAGCYSFDPVKTITCGEGGAMVTDDGDRYAVAHAWADHGHDHVGSDRGLEAHPIIGTNHRISELNAAVGLAQLRKLDRILSIQRAHKSVLKSGLSQVRGLSFRHVPDATGDSATFLTFFMPDEQRARSTAAALAEAGVDGCFYWFDNNWHYIRQWEHIKRLVSPSRLPIRLLEKIPDYENVDVHRSDQWMGRTLSMQIKLSWTAEDLEQRVEKMVAVISDQI